MPELFEPLTEERLIAGSLRRARERNIDVEPVQQRPPDPNATDGDVSYLGDFVRGVGRGVEGLVHGVYTLADMVTMDLLPDWDEEDRLIGPTQTWVGGLTSGVTQFLSFFIPVGGWVAAGAKVSSKIPLIGGKAVAGLSRLSKSAQYQAVVTSNAYKAAIAAGKVAPTATARSRAIGLGRVFAVGALADFTAFQGHEKRLSNLLQSFPALENPVTEFLQAEGNEDTIAGRLKATLEGMGLGALTDGLVHVVLGIRRGMRARAAGKSPDEAFVGSQDTDAVAASMSSKQDEVGRVVGDASRPTEGAQAASQGSLDKPVWIRPNEGRVTQDVYDIHLGQGEVVRVRKVKGEWVDVETGRKMGKRQGDVNNKLREPRREFAMSELKFDPDAGTVVGRTKDGKLVNLKKGATEEGKEFWQGQIGDEVVTLRSAFVRGEKNPRLVLRRFTAEEAAMQFRAGGRAIEVNATSTIKNKLFEGNAGDVGFKLERDPKTGEWFGNVGEDQVRIRRQKVKGDKRKTKAKMEWADARTGQPLRAKNLDQAVRRIVERQKIKAGGQQIAEGGEQAFEGIGQVEGANSLGIVDETQLRDIVDGARHEMEVDLAATNPRNLTPEELVVAGLKRNDLNLSRLLDSKPPAAVIRAIGKIFREMGLPKEAAKKTNLQLERDGLRRLNEMLGELDRTAESTPATPIGLMVDQHLEEATTLLEKTIAWRVLLMQSAEDVVTTAGKALDASAPGHKRALAEFINSVDRTAQALRAVKGATAIQGRALQSNNIPFRNIDGLLDMLDVKSSKADAMQLAKRMQALGDDPRGLFQLVDQAQGSTLFKMVTEAWMNAILSGGKTLFVNGLSGALITLYRPFEKLVGSTLAGSSQEFQIAMSEVGKLWSHFGHSMRAAWESGKAGHPLLLAGSETRFLEGAQGATGRHLRAISGQGASEVLTRHGLDPLNPSGGWYRAISLLGAVISTPAKILTGTDEFFKQLNFRSHAYNILLREELAKTGNGAFDVAVRNAERQVDSLIFRHQALSESVLLQKHMEALDPADFPTEFARRSRAAELAAAEWEDTSILRKLVIEDSGRQARESTFTTPLNPEGGALERGAAKFQEIVESIPVTRFFFTFIRTPFNIVRWASDRSVDPLFGRFRKLLQDALPGDLGRIDLDSLKNRYLRDMMEPDILRAQAGVPAEKLRIAEQRAQEATGRLRMGLAMTGTFAVMAANGQLTGAGPKDKETRNLLLDTGWLPYSLKIGDAYIEYKRLDPFATLLGTMADFYTAARLSGPEEQGALESWAMSAVLAVANNVTNKTYMTGMKNLVDGVLSGDLDKVQRVMQRYAASFIPAAVAQGGDFLASGDDPAMREVRSIGDAILNRMPYFGNELDPVRNFMGEPVRRVRAVWSKESNGVTDLFLPLAYREVTDKLVDQEVALLQHGFSPPRRKLGGIDLGSFRSSKGQSAYDRMLELRGEVKIGGKPIRRALRELMRSRRYQSMDPISTHEGKSPRVAEINRVIQRYARRAKRAMYREFPAVRAEIERVRRETLHRRGVGVLQRIEQR